MGQHEAWHTLSIEEAVTLLGTDLQRGLNTEEAQRRLTEVGPNELAERPRPGFWQILLNQFNSFLV